MFVQRYDICLDVYLCVKTIFNVVRSSFWSLSGGSNGEKWQWAG